MNTDQIRTDVKTTKRFAKEWVKWVGDKREPAPETFGYAIARLGPRLAIHCEALLAENERLREEVAMLRSMLPLPQEDDEGSGGLEFPGDAGRR